MLHVLKGSRKSVDGMAQRAFPRAIIRSERFPWFRQWPLLARQVLHKRIGSYLILNAV